MRRWFSGLLNVRRHIAARIFVALFVCLYTAMLAFVLIFYAMNTSQARAAMEQTARAALEKSHQQLAQTLAEVEELTAFLLNDQDTVNYLRSAGESPPTLAWFESYNGTLSLMRNYIVGRSRTIVGMGLFKKNGERCYTGTIYAPIYSDAFVPETNALILRVAYPYVQRVIPTGQGETAALITQLAEDFWAQAYGENVPDHHVVAVFAPDGGILYASGGFDALPAEVQDGMRVAADTPGARNAGADGHLLLSARSEATGLTAVTWLPGEAVAESLVSLNRQLGALLALLFCTTVLLSRALSLGITRNLKILKRNAELIGHGRYGETVPLHAQDELGELGQTMQELAARIQLLVEDINRRETMKREMELDILRAQVSPHFLYNALNTIFHLATLRGADNIGQYTQALIDLLQAALKPSDALISLETELSYVRSYHEIMKFRSVFSVRLDIHVAPEAHGAQVMRMALQPIVENAYIHGIGPQQQDGAIQIAVAVVEGALLIRVTDNGAGMTAEQIKAALSQPRNASPMRFSGIGIRNVLDRIRLQFGETYGLSIESAPGVYATVTLRMPLIRREDADA